MGTYRLISHPDTPPQFVVSITVESERTREALWLRFLAELDLDKLSLPEPAMPEPADGLWKTTCFEAFFRRQGEQGYIEFNLSPSSQWAAYRFSDYREGMAELALPHSPSIGIDASDSHFALEATISVPAAESTGALDLALSAVIEGVDGTKSYWALAHPSGKPDFHHPDCFALTLPAPDAP